jgi:Bacterial lectin
MKTGIVPLCIATIFVSVAPGLFAGDPSPSPAPAGPPLAPHYHLVFSDDFSTDPNTNGNWTIFRRQHDPNNEGYWDPVHHDWYLTRATTNLAIAAFANYELTAQSWKVDFRYRVDNGPMGADGFIFMFYKDKDAYGVPDSGSYMGFQTRNANGSDNPVPGYGVQFDTYQYSGCDPILENYVAIAEDAICNHQVYQPCSKIDDNKWHFVEFAYNNAHLSLTIDGRTVSGFTMCKPDYTFTGVGFGGGTGSYVSNQIIDNVQIWVADDVQ